MCSVLTAPSDACKCRCCNYPAENVPMPGGGWCAVSEFQAEPSSEMACVLGPQNQGMRSTGTPLLVVDTLPCTVSGPRLYGFDFPHGSAIKKSACPAGDVGDEGLIPGSGRSPGGGNGNPFQYSFQDISHRLPSRGSQRVGHIWVSEHRRL